MTDPDLPVVEHSGATVTLWFGSPESKSWSGKVECNNCPIRWSGRRGGSPEIGDLLDWWERRHEQPESERILRAFYSDENR